MRELFDDMAPDYDELRDLWYGYLFDRLHRFLARRYEARARGLRVLDVGCGTGQQALPFAGWGAKVVGLDLAAAPVRLAVKKAEQLDVKLGLMQASALSLPVQSARFDLAISCGSVISFVPDYDAMLDELRRAVVPGGEIAIEFEHRWSLDLLWPFLDKLAFGRLGYGQKLGTAVKNLVAPAGTPVKIDYPFTRPDGVQVVFHLWLFGAQAVDRALRRHGFAPVERHSIHSVTNLIPSTVLNDPHPSPAVARAFSLLSKIEDRVRDVWPFPSLGNSLFVVARRK